VEAIELKGSLSIQEISRSVKQSEGKLYDLDFFVESMHGQLKVTEISIHKEQGIPRYNW